MKRTLIFLLAAAGSLMAQEAGNVVVQAAPLHFGAMAFGAMGAPAAPIKGAPITSLFGMRFHPILHILRLHAGIDFGAPIVSVSLGLPAAFLWGCKRRSDPVRRLLLGNGDVAVWGGPARFVYHGVAPLKNGQHPLTGAARINLTCRKVF